MANAKKCDRCCSLYELYEGIDFGKDEYKYNWLRLFTTHGAAYKTYDLCPTCMTKVVAFLNNKEAESDGL